MTIQTFLNAVAVQIINPIIVIMIGLALVLFIWGVIELIMGAGNEEARSTGKRHMVWGIIGLMIMTGVWGIVTVLVRLFY